MVAALNGDLFEMSTGEGEGLQVEEGVVRRAGRDSVGLTDLPAEAGTPAVAS